MQVKFKAVNKNTKEIVFGCLQYNENDPFIISLNFLEGLLSVSPVEKETIEIFCGEYDEEGNEIYRKKLNLKKLRK